MVNRVSKLPNNRPIVDADGIPTRETRSYFNNVYNFLMITGNGTPENVVAAKPGALYTDLDATTGSILYVKKTGDSVTGWVLV